MTREELDTFTATYTTALRSQMEDARQETGDYPQTLRGNIRPSDMPPGVVMVNLPAPIRNLARIDVYGAPDGYGWHLRLEAVEGANTYDKTISCHEGGEIVAGPWILREPLP